MKDKLSGPNTRLKEKPEAMIQAMIVFLLIFCLSPAVRGQDYLLEAKILVSESQGQRMDLWIPLPLEDESQRVLSLEIKAPCPFLVTKEKEYGNRFLYLCLPPQKIEVSYRARIRRQEFSGIKAPCPPPSRFLLPDRLVPIEPFRSLARELVRGQDTPLDKLRTLYDYVVSNLHYDKRGKGWGRGDALFACSAKRGNCTDFHSLLMALARAEGIPVWFEIGLPVPQKGTEVKGYHCWLKAYVGGKIIGLDASEAAKNPALKGYYFGHLDEKRLLLTRGRDLLLSPPQHGERLNFLYQAYLEVDLKPAPELVKTRYYLVPVSD